MAQSSSASPASLKNTSVCDRPKIADILAATKPSVNYFGDESSLWRMRGWIVALNAPMRHLVATDSIPRTGDTPWHAALAQLHSACNTTPGAIVALLGGRGTGKTQLAVHALVDLVFAPVQRRGIGRYFRAADLFRMIRASMGTDGGEQSLVDAASKCRLLVLDEAHERANTDFESRTLTNIFDARYAALLPTVVISNHGREMFAESMGASVVSRMHEVGTVIECKWSSFREAHHA